MASLSAASTATLASACAEHVVSGSTLRCTTATTRTAAFRPSAAPVVAMANPHGNSGVFAPVVIVAKSVVGEKQFNQIRGKAIALHSQVIGEFCSKTGVNGKQRQGLIRLAKQNGAKLGFLA
eukprot:TRINITY_DN24304_c0_g1_i1.p2 TRINITY_DN24304_c0_g1~~TRINITY_DN24304_c0_g1_i1.p2  ORF type:complete len:122 (+),score=5.97 TRINITY_DN24304_c0_g1_i1:388-753(+)